MTLIFCIRLVGGVLDQEMRQALFEGAERMLRDRKSKAKVTGDRFEALVRTDWTPTRLAAIYGTRFRATIEIGKKKPLEIEYVIHSEHDNVFGKQPECVSCN